MSDVEEDENVTCLQENYNSHFEKLGEYARVAKAAMKKMKKAEEDYRSLLMHHKEAMLGLVPLNPIVWCYVCYYVWHYVWLNVVD